MLFYLDNWMSADPNAVRLGPQDALRPGNRQKQGLNENYGRELMELHTLGVDGGYTQKDVTEVARAFTGWTIGNPRQGGGYVFDARLHDAEKSWCSATGSMPAAANTTANRCSTSSRRIHRRRASSRRNWSGGSSATRHQRRSSIARRPDSATPTATSGR